MKQPMVFQARMVFERAVMLHSDNQCLWEAYILYLAKHLRVNTILEPVLERALKSCPNSPQLWCLYMRLSVYSIAFGLDSLLERV
jgi:hypothetical protein